MLKIHIICRWCMSCDDSGFEASTAILIMFPELRLLLLSSIPKSILGDGGSSVSHIGSAFSRRQLMLSGGFPEEADCAQACV